MKIPVECQSQSTWNVSETSTSFWSWEKRKGRQVFEWLIYIFSTKLHIRSLRMCIRSTPLTDLCFAEGVPIEKKSQIQSNK